MPYETAVTTDHDDCLDKLITFLTETITPVNQRWAVLKDTIPTATDVYTGQQGLTREVYLRGPGLSATSTAISSVSDNGGTARFNFTPGPTVAIGDEIVLSTFTETTYNITGLVTAAGAGYFEIDSIDYVSTDTGLVLTGGEAIHVNIRRFTATSVGGDADNFELRGAVAFDDALDFEDQPETCTACFLPLTDVSFTYWFIATGRYFYIVAKVSTTTLLGGGGFYLPYALPSEYPYPMFIIGTSGEFDTRWSLNTVDNICFWNNNVYYPGCRLRHRDGAWLPITQRTTPYYPFVKTYPVHNSNNYAFYITSNASSTGAISYTIIPYIFFSEHDNGNNYGEPQNLFFVPGYNNAAENYIEIDGVDYLVIQNVWRTENNADFCAIKLE